MINITSAETIVFIILLVIAYLFSITISGVIRAQLADKLGDFTPKELGYTSWNPLIHLELLSFIFLILSKLAWPTSIQFNPLNINDNYRFIKLIFFYLVELLIYITIAFIAMLLALIFYGFRTTIEITQLVFIKSLFSYSSDFLLIKEIAQLLPQDSSNLHILAIIFLISIVFVNICLAVTSLILNIFDYILAIGIHRGYEYIKYDILIRTLGLFVVLILFRLPMVNLLKNIFFWSAAKVALLTGIGI